MVAPPKQSYQAVESLTTSYRTYLKPQSTILTSSMRTSLFFIAAGLAQASAQVLFLGLLCICGFDSCFNQIFYYRCSRSCKRYPPHRNMDRKPSNTPKNMGPRPSQPGKTMAPRPSSMPKNTAPRLSATRRTTAPRQSSTPKSTARKRSRPGSSMETNFRRRSPLPRRMPSTYRR